ncbi:hypothetical protein HMPREF9429_00376 [Megasphaera micronuciformis F0359]|uniref:Uncharacterized protein n=1 Tax=Megasphaera micronuciformis F0359 TaxID=706434 RepID=E2ZAB5_9FIRM|nr:hypothetical protein HMPREF9429_00376 [Megasphaera micronuciformis F0359]
MRLLLPPAKIKSDKLGILSCLFKVNHLVSNLPFKESYHILAALQKKITKKLVLTKIYKDIYYNLNSYYICLFLIG